MSGQSEGGIVHSRTCEECGGETFTFERCHVCGSGPAEWRTSRFGSNVQVRILPHPSGGDLRR
jgi:hypothetical protein